MSSPGATPALTRAGTSTALSAAHNTQAISSAHTVVDQPFIQRHFSFADLLLYHENLIAIRVFKVKPLYRALKGQPRQHTYVFIGFTDEEKGDVGSHFYAHQLTKEQIAATDAMVNMDTLGLAPTAVDASHADQRRTIAFFDVARAMSLPASRINVPDDIGTTDSDEFSKRKIPSIPSHTWTQAAINARIVHSPKNQLSAIRPDNYYDTYKLVGAFLAFLDDVDSSAANGHSGINR